MFYVLCIMVFIYFIYKCDENGNFMYDSYGCIVYDYGDILGMQCFVLGNLNVLGSQSLDDCKNGKDYFSGNMFVEIFFLKDFKFIFCVGIENDNIC